MTEYVDVDIVENDKIIGSFKAERITTEKTEKKDEIKNKISMALKNPALQLGFEIICKNLSELEAENAELQDKLKNLSSVAEVRLANWRKYEKENAELKDLVRELNKGLDKLYLSGLSDKQIAFIERLQDKAEQFIEED